MCCILLKKCKLAACPFHWRMWKCLAITHWKHRMEMSQMQKHLQEILEVFDIPLFLFNFRDSWPTTGFNACDVSELYWYQFLVASSSSLFCVAVLLCFLLVYILNWVFPEAMNLCYSRVTRVMQALLCFSVLYSTGWLNDTLPWGSTNTVFQPHLRKIFYFSRSFFKNKLFCEMKPGFQCLCDPVFVSGSHILCWLTKLKLLLKLLPVSGTPNVCFQRRSFCAWEGAFVRFSLWKENSSISSPPPGYLF